MDRHLDQKAHKLLEALANSIHDRDPKSQTPFFFSINEVEIAEEWLKNFLKDFLDKNL